MIVLPRRKPAVASPAVPLLPPHSFLIQGARDSREEVAKVFALFDPEGHGRIGLRDLRRVAAELGEGLAESELADMIAAADRDGDGSVTFDDFLRVMQRAHRRSGSGGAAPGGVDDDSSGDDEGGDGGGGGGGVA